MANKHIISTLLLLSVLTTSFLPCLSCPYCPTTPSPPPPAPCPPPPKPKTPSSPPKTKTPPSSPSSHGSCPIDTLKLSVCVDAFGGLVHAAIGQSIKSKCCPLIEGVSDFDAALCLCTVIKAKALNINVVMPIAIEVLIDCGKHIPSDYQCPSY